MLDVCLRIFGPLLMVFGRALGLRLFRDAAMEMLSARDEVKRRAGDGDPASQAFLAKFDATCAGILGGDVGVPPSPNPPAGGVEAPAALEANTPFALGVPPSGADAPQAPERKKRGRPRALPPEESPSDGDAAGVPETNHQPD